ncbi:MAG: hypothetical protein AAGJ78_11825 [Pseudomonadota bacterium]
MKNRRLKEFKNASEMHLRFYVLCLAYSGNIKGYTDFRDLALYDYKKLQAHFMEALSAKLHIDIEKLEDGGLSEHECQEIYNELDLLYDFKDKYLITSEHTSWLQGSREIYFFHSILKIMITMKVNLNDRPDNPSLIGMDFWPQLKDTERKSQIKAQKERAYQRAEDRVSKPMIHTPESYINYKEEVKREAEEIHHRRQEAEERLKKRELDSIDRPPILEALTAICILCPTIDSRTHISIINSLTFSCIEETVSLQEIQQLLLRIKLLYLECNDTVSLKWGILKTTQEGLINKTYDRLRSQYNINRLFFPSSDPVIQKNCIITTLDLLYATTDNFEQRLKLITDRFSGDKAEFKSHLIGLNDKQWEMLVDLAGGDAKTKINRAFNTILKDAYKNRFSK